LTGDDNSLEKVFEVVFGSLLVSRRSDAHLYEYDDDAVEMMMTSMI